MVPDCTSVNGALLMFSVLVLQLQLCDQSAQTCLKCRWAETMWSTLLDWQLRLMDCGLDEGWVFIFLFMDLLPRNAMVMITVCTHPFLCHAHTFM
jgi:hypothetical protein